MAEKETNQKSSQAGSRKKGIINIINGNFLVQDKSLKQGPFILFLSCIAMLYIANGYYAERKVREINKISNDLKELRSEYITSKSKLMFHSKQSEVAKTAATMGLPVKESLVSPKKIIIEK